MSKKKDSMRREAMEIAFQALYQLGPSDDASEEDLKVIYSAIASADEGSEFNGLAWELAYGVWKNNAKLTQNMRSMSPQWLLDRLDQDIVILLKIMLYAIWEMNLPPKVVVRNVMDIVMWKARELAVQILYSLAFNPVDNIADLKKVYLLAANDFASPEEDASPQGPAWRLTEGVWRNRASLDKAIEKYSRHWRLDRMGKIELTVLRLSLYEFFTNPAIRDRVTRDALSLASAFGAGNARNFIVGILEAAIHARAKGEIVDLQYP